MVSPVDRNMYEQKRLYYRYVTNELLISCGSCAHPMIIKLSTGMNNNNNDRLRGICLRHPGPGVAAVRQVAAVRHLIGLHNF
jgi:hypothetical protein